MRPLPLSKATYLAAIEPCCPACTAWSTTALKNSLKHLVAIACIRNALLSVSVEENSVAEGHNVLLIVMTG
jgi:hypothetical protein